MDAPARVYRLESESQAREATVLLREAYRADAPRRESVLIRFLDTPDGRIARGGGRLALLRDGARRSLEWEPERGGPTRCQRVDGEPEFAWDLPAGPIRDDLAPRIEVRRLLPVVAVRLDCRTLELRDGRAKIVARIRIERGVASAPDARRSRRLASVLRLLPLRGYEAERARILDLLEQRLGLSADEPCTLERARAALGIEVPLPPGKPGDELRAGMRCDVAMKTLLRGLVRAVRRNEDGARRSIDTEFLHDFRVAVRRTRSALGQVPAVFPQAVTARYRRGFSWLGSVTGPLRDLDVMLLAMPGFRSWVGEDLREGLAPAEAMLGARRARAQRAFVAALDSASYRRLIEGWTAFLERPVPARTSLENATRPVEQVAAARIARARRRVMSRGAAIDDDSPAKALHRLRIDCKKLRYLLEFFREVFPGDALGAPIAALKKLQNNLGEFNDLAVARDLMGGRTGDADLGGREDPGATQALARLLELLAERQASVRQEFRERFDAFREDPAVAALGAGGEEDAS